MRRTDAIDDPLVPRSSRGQALSVAKDLQTPVHTESRRSLACGSGRGIVVLGLLCGACSKPAAPPPAAIPVSVATVTRSDVPLIVRATGTVEPIRTAAVQAQVSGQLLHVRFREGDNVTEGQTLFEIDPRPFEAALAQARGPLARDQAQYDNAQHDLQRYQALAAKEFVTQQQLDAAHSTVSSLIGLLRSDSAAVENARLSLQYATIRAPVSGRAGSVLVKEGNQVRGGAGQTLVVINQISPILVRFPVPALYFDAVRHRATQSLEVLATPVGDSSRAEKGVLIFLDNAVDSTTGTILLKASFANPDGALWPGALEAVALRLDVEKNVLVVPAAAVQGGQAGNVVWVLDSADKARLVKVQVVRATDVFAVLAGGVTPGQRVVVDGQLRLTDGVRVSVRSATGETSGDSGVRGARGNSAGGAVRKDAP